MSAETLDLEALAGNISAWARELGFADVGISDTDLSAEEARLLAWLDNGRHGEMDYMARHGTKRSRPAALVEGTIRIISARLDYWPGAAADSEVILSDRRKAYVSRYALGRDYHKLMRRKLESLAQR